MRTNVVFSTLDATRMFPCWLHRFQSRVLFSQSKPTKTSHFCGVIKPKYNKYAYLASESRQWSVNSQQSQRCVEFIKKLSARDNIRTSSVEGIWWCRPQWSGWFLWVFIWRRHIVICLDVMTLFYSKFLWDFAQPRNLITYGTQVLYGAGLLLDGHRLIYLYDMDW